MATLAPVAAPVVTTVAAGLQAVVVTTTAASVEADDGSSLFAGLAADVPIFGQNLLIIAIVLFGVMVAAGTRDQWGPPLYDATLGQIHCCSCRNCYLCGYCYAWCAYCLCCCSGKWGNFHPNFRLRILFHEARGLRKTDMFGSMQVFVKVRCGNNPIKTTSVQDMAVGLPILGGKKNNVIWNEPIDLEVATVDETISIECCDQDAMGDSVVGKCALQVSEFYSQMDRVGGTNMRVLSMPEGSISKRLLYGGNKDAGQIILSLFATDSGQPLPPVITNDTAPKMQGME